MRPSTDSLALAGSYRLAIARSVRSGAPGERLGRGTGASLEFQDRRNYVPGDDLRHLDWAAYARTDQLLVRLYREEILPRVEILLDASRSMASHDAKAARAVDLAAVVAGAARSSAMPVRLVALGDRPELIDPEPFDSSGVDCTGRTPLAVGVSNCNRDSEEFNSENKISGLTLFGKIL